MRLNTSFLAGLREVLRPRRLFPILTVAIISGLVVTTYQISYGTLIFAGDLSPYLSNGIGFCLMGVVLIAGIEALMSGNPGMVAIPTVNSAVILATMATGLAASMERGSRYLFPTVAATMTIAALLTGGAFLALGWFRMGNLIRFIPYPVIGGFLAGTGWLVLTGALKTMNGVALNVVNVPQFITPAALLRWLPGTLLGVFLLLLTRRFKHYLITPSTILISVLIFYVVLWLTGSSSQEAVQSGLLFSPFPPGALWRPPPLTELSSVDWLAVVQQAGGIATLILISSITLLLYASGVEVSAEKEINLNQELRACGTANLAAAFSASPPGYTIITMSVLSHRLGANSRLVGLLVAAICAAVMFFGGPLIALFPKPVLGGVLISLGLTFLTDWLIIGWRKLSKPDYAIVVIILLVMSAFGLLPGLGTGVALSAGLFILQYSKVPVIRHALSGRNFHSKVERSDSHIELLRREGQGLLIVELQGYIFFGTAHNIYEQIKARLESMQMSSTVEKTRVRAVMLDFRRVGGIDASASLSFARLKRYLKQLQIPFCFTHLSSHIEEQLRRDVLTAADQEAWNLFPDLDHGVEWFEEIVLQSEAGQRAEVRAHPGAVQVGQEQGGLAMLFAFLGVESLGNDEAVDQALLHLLQYLERVDLEAGDVLIKQGEIQHSLYFLDSGEVTVEYRTDDSRSVRLAASGPGTILGELSLYLDRPASATVIATQPSIAYRLSAENLNHLEHEQPTASVVLHRYLLKRVGQRLISALETIDALAD